MFKSLKNNFTVFLKGGAIGVANIIPGVSGGTIAVVLGIYDKLIESISGFFTEPKKRWGYLVFLIKIFSGAAVFILLLANVMDFMLKQHFAPTMFLFMGLILGGIPVVVRSHGDMALKFSRVIFFLLGAALIFGISFFAKEDGAGAINLESLNTMPMGGLLFLVLAGFLAGGAMIVPGVSGSFILVLIGQYAVIVASIKALAIKPLAAVSVGAAIGILIFSKIIAVLLKKNPAVTYYFILGLIVASLYEIFPGIPLGHEAGLYCGGALLLGSICSWGLARIN